MRRTRNEASRSNLGFTLVEILIALAVVLLALVPLIRLHVLSMAMLDAGRQRAKATLLANARIAEIMAMDVPAVGDEKGVFEDPQSGAVLHWSSMVKDIDPPELEGAGIEGIREIRVDVTWDAGGPGATVSLCTLVCVEGLHSFEASDHVDDAKIRENAARPRTRP